MTGFDARKIEHIIKDSMEMVRRRIDDFGRVALLAVERRGLEGFGGSDEAIQRGANLVTDTGQKLVFSAIGRGEIGVEPGEFFATHF